MKRDQLAMQRAKREQRMCRVCKSLRGLEIHHVVPRSRSQKGAEDDANLVALCHDCHRGFHSRTLDLGIYLSPEESAHAVQMCGTVYAACRLLYPASDPHGRVAA